MPAFSASAPGKVILFGEHAVVYQRPALAAPVFKTRTKVTVQANLHGQPDEILLDAPDIGLKTIMERLPLDNPLVIAINGVKNHLQIRTLPAMHIRITSSIPVAAGLGSGAAVSVALVRALSGYLGHPLNEADTNTLAYEVEKRLHGTPSGIDNTVITYARPVWFIREQPFELINIAKPLHLVIAHSGISAPTKKVVADVRQQWEKAPAKYEVLFDSIADLTRTARQAIETGNTAQLGNMMNQNHLHLAEIGVSCPELDRLVAAAIASGATGAKLSGGGRGGNMIALVTPETAATVAEALTRAGAIRTIITTLQNPE
jgi:mevalonate kinase